MKKTYTFTRKQQKEFDREFERRLNEIIYGTKKREKKPSTIKLKDNKEVEGLYIVSCEKCKHYKNCNHTQDCKEDIDTGKGLRYFKEKNKEVI